jgi:two-component system KDP operon response regulator KdpE
MDDLKGKKILVIDDEPGLLDLLEQAFRRSGVRVLKALNAQEGLQQFFAQQPDLVILDLMLPDVHGWEVCRQIRQLSDVPLIILSVLSKEEEVIYGLDCGADDYITKPFNLRVLLARVRSALRREVATPAMERAPGYSNGHLTIDTHRRRVWARGEPVKLRPTEYRLLVLLAENAGRIVTVEEILNRIWGPGCEDRTQYVHSYIWRLRQKLEPDPENPRYLLSERGVGYCFERRVV